MDLEPDTNEVEAMLYVMIDKDGNSLTWEMREWEFGQLQGWPLRSCLQYKYSQKRGHCFIMDVDNKPVAITFFNHNLYIVYHNGTLIQYKLSF